MSKVPVLPKTNGGNGTGHRYTVPVRLVVQPRVTWWDGRGGDGDKNMFLLTGGCTEGVSSAI